MSLPDPSAVMWRGFGFRGPDQPAGAPEMTASVRALRDRAGRAGCFGGGTGGRGTRSRVRAPARRAAPVGYGAMAAGRRGRSAAAPSCGADGSKPAARRRPDHGRVCRARPTARGTRAGPRHGPAEPDADPRLHRRRRPVGVAAGVAPAPRRDRGDRARTSQPRTMSCRGSGRGGARGPGQSRCSTRAGIGARIPPRGVRPCRHPPGDPQSRLSGRFRRPSGPDGDGLWPDRGDARSLRRARRARRRRDPRGRGRGASTASTATRRR